VFTGEYRHAIDSKGRVAVPARFRAELARGAHVSRWIDNCLAIFPDEAWARLADRVAGLRHADAGARSFSRFLFSGAFDVELDGQGRVVLPAGLREFAGLKSEAVVVGALDHIELWEPGRWAGYSAEMNSADVFAARIADLGI
jgi:MraZ protein